MIISLIKKILFIFLLFIPLFSYSQQSEIDSLHKLLAIGKEDSNKVKDIYTLCALYIDQGNYDSAIYYGDAAIQLGEKINFKKGVSAALGNLANVYWYQGDYARALEACFKALEIDKRLGNKKRIAANIGNIGNIYADQGNYPKALDHYFKALKINEEIKNKNQAGSNNCNIGNVYCFLGDYSKALDYYFKSLKIHEALKNKRKISRDLGNIGNAYAEKGDHSKALDYFFKALKIEEELGDVNGIASDLGSIGRVYHMQGNYSKALDYYMKSLKMDEELGNKSSIATDLGYIGSLYTKLSNYKDAEVYLAKALSIAKEIGSMDVMKIQHENLSTLYEKWGKPGKALEHYKQHIELKDSIFNEEKDKQITRKEMNYEFEKKEAITKAEHEKQAAVAAAESRKQQILIWAVISGLLLVAVFSVFMFNRWRVTQAQKKIIEEQKFLVDEKNKIIEEKNKDITDSINYAQRIQGAILPPDKTVKEYLPECFILYLPKDVVSGDFYFVEKKGSKVVFAAVDCTGHGVPGAMMSVVGFNYLSQAVNEKHLTKPSELLRFLDIGVNQTLRQSAGSGVNDGMDLSLCTLNMDSLELEYAGAYNPLWIIRKSMKVTCEEIGADKFPIGVNIDGKVDEYTNHVRKLEKGDAVYLFTDGFADQFGGRQGKKFKYRQLEEKLLSISDKPMEEQKKMLGRIFDEWKGNLEQIDDVLVIGVRI